MNEILKEKKNKFELIIIATKRTRDLNKNNTKKYTIKEKTYITVLKEMALLYKDEINIF